jgi:glycosyltransferase involved in cell wall biosynthesis
MRILLISSNSSGRGGGEKYLVYLTDGLKRIGIEVHVLVSTIGYMDSWSDELRDKGAVVHRKDLIGLAERPFRFLQAIFDSKQQSIVRDVCTAVSPALVIVNQQYDEDGLDLILGALSSHCLKVASIMHMPMTASKNFKPFGKLRGWYLKRWYRKTKFQIIFSSKGSLNEFQEYYGQRKNCDVIVSGISFSNNGSHSKPTGTIEPSPTLGFVGQFVKQKNINTLIEAWSIVRMSIAGCKLLLIGDGPDREEIEAHLRRVAGESDWVITGWSSDYSTHMKNVDLLVMPSHFESLPLALIEAIGNGIPALTSNFNGAEELANHAAWMSFVSDVTSATLASEIMKRIDSLTEARQFANSGCEKFQNYFSSERMATDYVEVSIIRSEGN